jgi:hypothetical protein
MHIFPTSILYLLFNYYSIGVKAYTIETEIRLGVLFPSTKLTGQFDFVGNQYLAAILMAIRELNDKTDGILDNLLPGANVTIAARSSQRGLL